MMFASAAISGSATNVASTGMKDMIFATMLRRYLARLQRYRRAAQLLSKFREEPQMKIVARLPAPSEDQDRAKQTERFFNQLHDYYGEPRRFRDY